MISISYIQLNKDNNNDKKKIDGLGKILGATE